MGKANWIRKIFVMIKNNRAMIIYLDCSGDGKYDFKKSKYMVKKIESPSKNDDAMFYKCFLKNSKDSDELGIYSVQNGDNLWKISEHFYGDGTLFDKVKNHNKLKSGGLRIGQSLRIPKL
jgi:LysM repeat protein